MAGLPGLNVPCGLSEGPPVGFQIIGLELRGREHVVRRRCMLERAIGFDPVPERLR